MRKTLMAMAASAALAMPGAAAAGGWATAGLAPPGDGIQAGDTWNARVTILQHGRTPLSGVEPTVTIRNDAGKTVTFSALPTGEAGVYEAKVKFPSGGAWSYEVYDGFEQYGGAQRHTFGPVTIEPRSGNGISFWPILLFGLALAAVLVVGAVAWVTRSRQRRSAIPALR